MVTLLSPSKAMHTTPHAPVTPASSPQFATPTQALVNHLQTLSETDIASLLGISDKLATLNYQRYADWSTIHPHPALWLYAGDVYNGFDANTLADTAVEYAQQHLMIISGLYGLIRPLDAIKPYRLEMGTKIDLPEHPTLYDFWGNTLTQQLEQYDDTFVICASKEYARAVMPHFSDTSTVITPRFFQKTSQGYREKGLFAKYARGHLARWIIDQRIDSPSQLTAYTEDGFCHSPELSTRNTIAFVIPEDFSLKGRFTR